MESLLAAEGAVIDQTHYCPHAPETVCDCRKPGTALYRKALDSLGMSGHDAFFIGDRLSDLDAADVLGGRRIMVLSNETPAADALHAREHHYLVESLAGAVERILGPEA
jgi:D-glycero-D-manno-heptose 1,7-bisphosphate phosphatase